MPWTGSEARPAKPGGASSALLVALMAIAMLINYVDRGNLATAAPLIKDDLRLSNGEAGILLSAFFWTYTPCQLLAGWLAERINPYRTLAIGAALWAAATFATGFAGGFTALLAWRLVLGIGESASYPCNTVLLIRHVPPARLGAATGLLAVGQALGPAVGTFGGGLLLAAVGWRPMFLIFGALSAIWLIPWLIVGRRAARAAATTPHGPAPSYPTILGRSEVWGAGLGHFANNYGLYFVISWLPLYLVKSRGFTLTEMAAIGGMVYVVYAIASQASGLFADHLLAGGADNTRLRKGFAAVAHLGITATMLGCALGSPAVSILALLASGLFFGMNALTITAVSQTLGGIDGAHKWMGVQNGLANCAGIAAPLATGFIVDAAGFTPAFAIAAAVSLLGLLGWCVIIRRVEPIDWQAAEVPS